MDSCQTGGKPEGSTQDDHNNIFYPKKPLISTSVFVNINLHINTCEGLHVLETPAADLRC